MMDRETWLGRILEATRDLADEGYQERVWVRGEGPEVDSSTEAICRLVDDYDLPTFLAEAAKKAWLSKDQIVALRRLEAALARYAGNGEDANDATRIQTPGWQKIRKLAKAAIEAFTTPAAPDPEWIDQVLSKQLPVLRDQGEGQHLEFMAIYPTNGHELSREIAAFASSNPGTILIGIADDGGLKGLANAESSTDRDTLCRRIEGLCTSSIKPSITPAVKFAREGDAIVLAIEVPRGKQPIYYSRGTPYIRHLSQSRPAEPHEVIERISEWLATTPQASAADDAQSTFFSSLASTLIDVVIYGEELEHRSVNPWLDLVLLQLAGSARDLRQLATDDVALGLRLDTRLREIADNLDRGTSQVLTLAKDSWQTLASHVAQAVDQARHLKSEYIDKAPMAADSTKEIYDLIRRAARELTDLDRRAFEMTEAARTDEVQEQASRIGYRLLRLSHYKPADVPAALMEQISEIGRNLHLLETERLYMDGGQSIRAVLERLHNLVERLESVLAEHQI